MAKWGGRPVDPSGWARRNLKPFRGRFIAVGLTALALTAGINAPLAVAGDTIVSAAAAPFFVPSSQRGATPTASSSGATPAPARRVNPQVVALKLGP